MKVSRRVILIGIGIVAGSFAILGGVTVWVVTQPLWPAPGIIQLPPVDAARLEKHTRKLSEELVPRDWAHTENLDRVAAYIRDEFVMGGAVSLQDQAYNMAGRTYRNVVAQFGPESKEAIIVGAHYDAFSELPGADDNASGVAGLIELAHLLGRTTLPIRVEVVAFTLEEPKTRDGDGLFRSQYGGSSVHVRSLKERGITPRIFINLEMIGYFSDKDGSQSFPAPFVGWLYPSRGNFIAIVGRIGQRGAVQRVKAAMRGASKLAVYSMTAHEIIEGVDWSDHANYWKAGHDAVMITDMALNRNRNYHTERDTPELLDYSRMAMVVQGVYAVVLDFAH